MVTIRLNAVLKPNGQLDYELPAELPTEDFELVLDVKHAADGDEEDISPEDAFDFQGLSLGQIKTGGWEHLGITDSVEWIEKQREQ